MDDDQSNGGSHARWARLRFAVVGALLAAPPARGELKAALAALTGKRWRHPTKNDLVLFGFSTLERWYYQAKRERRDPVAALRRRVRKDAGQMRSMTTPLRQMLAVQYQQHRSWSYQLHYDNLCVLAKKLGLKVPSYSSVWRYMKALGLLKRKRLGPRNAPGTERAEERVEQREVRSFEVEYVGGLFHADFHSGSLKVLTPAGLFATAFLLAVMDDHSRLCGHAQWYLAETAENYVHGLSQVFQKRGLPRAFMEDNGAPMIACETQGPGTARHHRRADAAVQPVPEREAGGLLGPGRGPAPGDARGRDRPDPRAAQRRHAGVGRAGVQPQGPLGDERGAASPFPRRQERPSAVAVVGGAPRRLHYRGRAHPAALRRHGHHRGRPLRGPVALPSPRTPDPAPRALGSVVRAPCRPEDGRHPRPALPARPEHVRQIPAREAQGQVFE